METWQLCSQTAAVLLVKTLFIIVVLETAVEPQKEERRQNKPESFQRKTLILTSTLTQPLWRDGTRENYFTSQGFFFK